MLSISLAIFFCILFYRDVLNAKFVLFGTIFFILFGVQIMFAAIQIDLKLLNNFQVYTRHIRIAET
jgi:hypothetical protein